MSADSDVIARPSRLGRLRERGGSLAVALAPLALIILANLVLFAIQSVTGGASGGFTRDGGLAESAVDDGQWWRLITGGFLHMDVAHIVGNLTALAVLGPWLIKRVGPERFVWAYLVGLLCADWGSMLLQSNAFAIGASGAIFGVAGTLFVVGVRQRTPIAIAMVGAWIAWSVYMTFAMSGVAWGAHLGGLLGGMAIGAAIVSDEDRVVRPILASRVVGVALVLLSLVGALTLA